MIYEKERILVIFGPVIFYVCLRFTFRRGGETKEKDGLDGSSNVSWEICCIAWWVTIRGKGILCYC